MLYRFSCRVGCLVAFCFLVSVVPAEQPGAAKKPITVDDLYRLDSPQGLSLAPDGKSAVYVRQWIDPVRKEERHSLWLVEGSRTRVRSLEEGEPDARTPFYSPDGKWIVFLSTRPRPDGWKQTPPAPPQSDPAVDLWLLPVGGGQAIPLAGPEKPHGRVFNDGFYGRVAFSPDGRKLAFVADDGAEPRTPEESVNRVTVVRPDQGEGYTGYRPAQVWVAELDEKPGKWAARKIQRLTKDDVWYGDPQWSPDGKTLVVHANRTDERESVRYSINHNFDLWAIDVESGKLRQLTDGPGPEVSPRFTPDGNRLVCLSVPRRGPHRDIFNLAVVELTGEKPRFRVLFNHHEQAADRALPPAPAFPLPTDCWDGDRLLYSTEDGVRTRTVRLNLDSGEAQVLDLNSKELPKPGLSTALSRLLLHRQLYPAGNPFLKERQVAESRVFRWKNEGLDLEGIVTVPPNSGKGPLPLVVNPHGGPHSRSVLGFDFTAQVLAGRGYAVFQPNFRGSSGYGKKFLDADRLDLGGGDMRDILAGVDELIRAGTADKDRLFVYATSYGGFMTSWLVGQTDRFRAAVAQNAVTDLNMMWSLSDLQSWTEWEFAGRPWEVPERMRKHSPLTYADKVKTPTLILHSRDDRRCPLPMGRAFHQALQARKVPTQLVIYPNEGHGIRQPRHREDVLRRVLEWFDKYDKK